MTAGIALDAQKPVFEQAALQVVVELLLDEMRQGCALSSCGSAPRPGRRRTRSPRRRWSRPSACLAWPTGRNRSRTRRCPRSPSWSSSEDCLSRRTYGSASGASRCSASWSQSSAAPANRTRTSPSSRWPRRRGSPGCRAGRRCATRRRCPGSSSRRSRRCRCPSSGPSLGRTTASSRRRCRRSLRSRCRRRPSPCASPAPSPSTNPSRTCRCDAYRLGISRCLRSFVHVASARPSGRLPALASAPHTRV